MVKTAAEIMSAVQARIGDDTSDEAIAFVADISDTLNSLSSGEDWKARFEENDKQWRQKYRDAFFSAPVEEPQEQPDNTPRTFEDLFMKG